MKIQGTIDSKGLIKDFVALLDSHQATVFLGAGLSCRSGLPLWGELMKDPAKMLGKKITSETDLYSLAEVFVQKHGRNTLNDMLIKVFRNQGIPDESHKILARLPFEEYWTSNFDKLLEKALTNAGRGANCIFKDEQFAHRITDPVKVFRVHGCIQNIGHAVITRSDLESYSQKYSVMLQSFYSSLAQKTFLFIGFGFSDQNFRAIIGQLRVRYMDKGRIHYALLKEPAKKDFEAFSLMVQDLKNYGIKVCTLTSHDQIIGILAEIENAFLRKNILVSGSYKNFPIYFREASQSLVSKLQYSTPIPFQKTSEKDQGTKSILSYGALLEKIGERILREGYNINTGFGIGACDLIVEGAYPSDQPHLYSLGACS